jgi:hypothetical protein
MKAPQLFGLESLRSTHDNFYGILWLSEASSFSKKFHVPQQYNDTDLGVSLYSILAWTTAAPWMKKIYADNTKLYK